jgi:PhzF family phenazine biosynthesis protein
MTRTLAFRQVDVFASGPLLGNPVAVVHHADDLTDDQMAAFARWTNLSETTFLLAPTVPVADYRLRIFTPGGELPFAGHPTLGSAHAWLEAGGRASSGGREDSGSLVNLGGPDGPNSREGSDSRESSSGDIVQECRVGLVTIRRDVTADGTRLAFAAPPLRRSGPVDEADVARIALALRISQADILDAAWVDNGPGWVAVRLRDGAAVLALQPDFVAFDGLKIGVVGLWSEGDAGGPGGAGGRSNADSPGDADCEVRAFVPTLGIHEDPVTGSLNASLGQWLAGSVLPDHYVASQGTALGRRGRVFIDRDESGTIWVGGQTRTTIEGTVTL